MSDRERELAVCVTVLATQVHLLASLLKDVLPAQDDTLAVVQDCCAGVQQKAQKLRVAADKVAVGTEFPLGGDPTSS